MFKILLVVALLSAFADAKRSKVPKFSDIPVKDINNKTASLPASDDKCLLVVLYGRESTGKLPLMKQNSIIWNKIEFLKLSRDQIA